MRKVHNVYAISTDAAYLYLSIDEKSYQIRWEDYASKLAKANWAQRNRFEVAPSGYGIHWPELDEDWAITPMLRRAKVLMSEETGSGATTFDENLVWRDEERRVLKSSCRDK